MNLNREIPLILIFMLLISMLTDLSKHSKLPKYKAGDCLQAYEPDVEIDAGTDYKVISVDKTDYKICIAERTSKHYELVKFSEIENFYKRSECPTHTLEMCK